MRVLVVEDEPYMAEAIRDGLRLEAIAAAIARNTAPSSCPHPYIVIPVVGSAEDGAGALVRRDARACSL